MILEDDPAWFGSIWTIIRYAQEVWLLHTGAYNHTLSWAEIRGAWESAFGPARKISWRRVAGPMMAMRLSLFRIGWSMNSFTELVDDFGVPISLTLTSPKLIGILLKQAVLRGLERDVASKEGVPGRICFDIMKSASTSRRFSPLERACIRNVTTNAVWTMVRARSLGYQVESTACPLCGEHPDTLLLRLWSCPSCQQEREEVLGEKNGFMIQAALEAEEHEDILLYTRGLFRHPGDKFPRPLTDGGIVFQNLAPGGEARSGQDFALEGHLFIDGSCHRHPIRELSRTGFGATVLSPGGDPVASMYGPLWAPWPQTPQGGEYGTFAAVMYMLCGPTSIYSDCQSIVNHWHLATPLALSHKRAHAGFMLQARGGGTRHVREVIKVRAHQALDPALPADEFFRRVGNNHADRLANSGREQHPGPTTAEAKELARKISVAKMVAKLSARLLPSFPRLQLQDVPWENPRGAVEVSPDTSGHNWCRIRDVWQCSICLRGSRLPQPPSSKCPGPSGLRGLSAEELRTLGHTMAAYDCSDGSFIAVCTRCKQYSSGGQVRGLKQKCPPQPVRLSDHSMRGRRCSWNKIARGVHPRTDGVTLQFVDLTAEGMDASPRPPEPPPPQGNETPGQVLRRVARELREFGTTAVRPAQLLPDGGPSVTQRITGSDSSV